MSRILTATACALVGMAVCTPSAKADALSTLAGIYGSSSGFTQVTPDGIWHPVVDTPTALVKVKYATDNFLLSTTNASGGSVNVFGAVQGTGNSPSTGNPRAFQYNPFSGTFGTTTGSAMVFNPSDPFAWRINTYTGTISSGQSLSSVNQTGSQYFSSLSATPDYMVAYRMSGWDADHYVLLWSESGSGNYNDLVFEVQGVRNPEPASMTLMGLGLAGLVGYGVRYVRRRKSAPAETPAVA